MDAATYIEVLKTARRKTREKRGYDISLLHHDNASSHTAQKTAQYLAQSDIAVVPQAPYSPDTSPCHFFLFMKLKDSIAGKTFKTAKECPGIRLHPLRGHQRRRLRQRVRRLDREAPQGRGRGRRLD